MWFWAAKKQSQFKAKQIQSASRGPEIRNTKLEIRNNLKKQSQSIP